MENDRRPCLVLTAWPADRPVAPFAQGLVDARLAACVHAGPVGASVYRWHGAVESVEERPLVIKTVRACLVALQAHVMAAHPYEVPEWLVLDVDGSAAYVAWLGDSVTEPEPTP